MENRQLRHTGYKILEKQWAMAQQCHDLEYHLGVDAIKSAALAVRFIAI
jgi:hypothetical protein